MTLLELKFFTVWQSFMRRVSKVFSMNVEKLIIVFSLDSSTNISSRFWLSPTQNPKTKCTLPLVSQVFNKVDGFLFSLLVQISSHFAWLSLSMRSCCTLCWPGIKVIVWICQHRCCQLVFNSIFKRKCAEPPALFFYGAFAVEKHLLNVTAVQCLCFLWIRLNTQMCNCTQTKGIFFVCISDAVSLWWTINVK